jgi:Holliday junction DNA helicase RuvA
MIGRLQGILAVKQPTELLVNVAGVGYEVMIPMTTFYQLPDVGAGILLHTHLIVRDDAHQLYGFHSERERELFRLLIKVNGVGPKLGITILSSMEPSVFVQCIAESDLARLVKIPGIGKKTAERLVIEMRDRLKNWQGESPAMTGKLSSAEALSIMEQEAIDALVALGYKPQDAARTISKLDGPFNAVQEIIRQALQRATA